MSNDLVKQAIAELQDVVRCRCHEAYKGRGLQDPSCECDSADAVKVVANCIEELEAELVEARRRRDAWRAKAEGYDEVRLALREKVGAPWPPNLSRILWAGIAADERRRADDAEAEVERLREVLGCWTAMMAKYTTNGQCDLGEMASEFTSIVRAALAKTSTTQTEGEE